MVHWPRLKHGLNSLQRVWATEGQRKRITVLGLNASISVASQIPSEVKTLGANASLRNGPAPRCDSTPDWIICSLEGGMARAEKKKAISVSTPYANANINAAIQTHCRIAPQSP